MRLVFGIDTGLQPGRQVLHTWMCLLQLLHIRPITFPLKEREHGAHFLRNPQHQSRQDIEGHWWRRPSLFLEYGNHLFVLQLVTSKTDSLIFVRLGLHESLCPKKSDIICGNELKWSLDPYFPRCSEDLADETAVEVLHESCRAQYGPVHSLDLGLANQVFLDVVFADKVWNIGRIVGRSGATAVDGGVDEMLDAILQCSINECLALSLLDDGALAIKSRYLGIESA